MKNISYSILKARKQHVCDWCGLNISIGETYENLTNEHEGELYTWKNHISCKKISEKIEIFNEYWDEGLDQEGFKEGISDEYMKLVQAAEGNTDYIPSFVCQLDYVKKHHLINT